MAKILDLSKTVYELTEQYPELIEIMRELGFTEIVKPGMRQSAGRIMTIPKGSKMKKIPMEKIIMTLIQNGFTLAGERPNNVESGELKVERTMPQIVGLASKKENRTEQIKALLRRLGAGEDLESVREDFRRDFSNVDSSEIMQAEQELMKEGTPLEEVQKLCDIHSALFHGKTREEEANRLHDMAGKNQDTAAALVATVGHPLYTFTKENEALRPLLDEANNQLADGNIPLGTIKKIREIAIHYAKKGDLLYPLLFTRYDISGPQNVMWTVDDEIRDTLGQLLGAEKHDDEWIELAKAVLMRADEMIYKETNILFPICAANLKAEEWFGIYRDSQPYAICLGVDHDQWQEAEEWLQQQRSLKSNNASGLTSNEVFFPNGSHMTVDQLNAMLNTMPLEISFVDENNINRYFNEGEKVFMRPDMAIDREVFTCHPPKIEPMVRAIINDFRTGVRDQVPVWMEKNGHTMLVTYMAVRNSKGEYVGTMEIVRDMEDAKEYFKNK